MPVDQPQATGQDQPGPDPADQLAVLRNNLDKNKAQIEGLSKDRDALTAEVGVFAQCVDDAKKVLAAYNAAYPGFDADMATLDTYDQEKMGLVHIKLSDDRRKRIDRIVNDYDANEMATKKKAADDSAADAAKAQADSDAARTANQAVQVKYNAMKSLQASLTSRDAAAKQLSTEIDGYEAKRNYDAMYLRLKDAFEPATNDLRNDLVPLDEFKAELYQAASQVHETWKAARDKKANAEAAATTAVAAQAAYAAALAGRKAELLKRVAALPPAPAPQAPVQAPASHPA